jgi:hypothetical protein
MFADYWGTVAVATGMWIIACAAVIGGDTRTIRPDGVVWTVTSNEKVASHPTLVRRSMPRSYDAVRTAALGQPL